MLEQLIADTTTRKHDFAIGGEENPYCLRWWVVPRNNLFNIYLHQFLRDDDDRALHCHPWPNCSIPLETGYREQLFVSPWEVGKPLPDTEVIDRPVGTIGFREAHTPHRIILHRDQDDRPIPAWSLFFTGPVIRDWGFVCPEGRWVPWQKFTAFEEGDYGRVGRGCGE